ncbi:MAG: glycoside hydrolase family 10 protein [Oscillospiraceae bacterium]
MRKLFIVISLFCLLCSCSSQSSGGAELQMVSPTPECEQITLQDKHSSGMSYQPFTDVYQPLNYDCVKAVWISYIDLSEMLTGKTKDEFKSNFSKACFDIKALGCNTVYTHVRAFSDAYYDSQLFPHSKGIIGTIDSTIDFDPLEIMVETAHKYGLSFHAWINPLRCETKENIDLLNDKYKIKQWYNDPERYDEYIVKVESDRHYWLNPAIKDVRSLICSGVAEIIENYNVDGIHMDDYFYPTDELYFDAGTYVEAGVTVPLSDWRLDNCSQMVSEIYDTVKKCNPQVQFGISPQGNIENNYDFLFADVRLWCSTDGYVDYIAPQIYFGYENSQKPFIETINEWSEIVTDKNTKLIIGLAPYKIFDEEEFQETTGIIAKQISDSFSLDNCSGTALYNYLNMFNAPQDDVSRMNEERSLIKTVLSDH